MKVITIDGQRYLAGNPSPVENGAVTISGAAPISAVGPVDQGTVDSYLVAEKLGELEEFTVSGNPQITLRDLKEAEEETLTASRIALKRAEKDALPKRVVGDFLTRG